MKILQVHNHYRFPGGEDQVVAAEAELLRSRGHEVIQYTEHNQSIDTKKSLRLASDVLWSRRSYNNLAELLLRHHFDLAHFHNTFPQISPSAYWACHKAEIPIVQTLHNYRSVCPAATLHRNGRICEDCLGRIVPWPAIRHACYRKSRLHSLGGVSQTLIHQWIGTWRNKVSGFIALTGFARSKFIQAGFPAHKIVVKPNFVHPDPGTTDSVGQFALYVGRLSEEKGLETLLHAWEKLEQIPIKIVGEGPLMEELHSRQSRFDHTTVEILGNRSHSHVLRLMRKARFLIIPSHCYENFPVVLAESFACGLPVVASRLGALAELVDDGRSGFLFQVGDADDLAAKCESIWEPDVARRMGWEARREFEKKYTAALNYSALNRFYEKESHRTGQQGFSSNNLSGDSYFGFQA